MLGNESQSGNFGGDIHPSLMSPLGQDRQTGRLRSISAYPPGSTIFGIAVIGRHFLP